MWVHGDDSVPLGYIINIEWFFSKLQEFWVVTDQGILGPSGCHNCVRAQYLSRDRPEIQCECRELVRKLQSNLDETEDWPVISECVRGWFGCSTRMESWRDTDHVGCKFEPGRAFLAVR